MTQPRARSEQLVVQELPGELLIYDLERHKASCLNQTASGVWKKCDGARNVADIAAELTVEWGAAVDEELVWVTLEKLGRAHLLCEKVEQPEGDTATRDDEEIETRIRGRCTVDRVDSGADGAGFIIK